MRRPEVTVVDHGLCNLFNLCCALEEVGARVVVTRDATEIASADRLILPGVGAFEPAMRALRELGLVEAIQSHAAAHKPTLGICLGMQLLMAGSQENGQHAGLGLIGGHAVKFLSAPAGGERYKVPQIGWNTLDANPALTTEWRDPLLADVPQSCAVYFVHSYYVVTDNVNDTLAYANYAGVRYSAMLRHGAIWGAQFHPERSAKHGLKMLSNFVRVA